ncbi:hypothetical protein C460_01075 [Haloferax sp. ATCC BAA-646]|nr:hypothetical protein C459_16096 [Haloferax sp. ATCC BAA-645]ELZ61757.1 hypothetical protein C460_01075 [Haloferax sp. ATCC BAA-646]
MGGEDEMRQHVVYRRRAVRSASIPTMSAFHPSRSSPTRSKPAAFAPLRVAISKTVAAGVLVGSSASTFWRRLACRISVNASSVLLHGGPSLPSATLMPRSR